MSPLILESRHAEASAPRARLSRRVSSGLLSLIEFRGLRSLEHEETIRPEVVFSLHVAEAPVRPSQLPNWYSSGVVASLFLHEVYSLHPEVLQGSFTGLPFPSRGHSVGRHPLVTHFLHSLMVQRSPTEPSVRVLSLRSSVIHGFVTEP